MKKIFWQLLVIMLVALAVIYYQFATIPQNLAFDEVEFAKLALSLDGTPYTPYSPIAFGHSTLYFYILLLSFKIFGITTFALRFPSSLFGIAGVVVFYLVLEMFVRNQKSRAVSFLPLVSSLVLITSRWYFNFARFSFEATFLLFLELMSLYFLLLFFKNKNARYVILCGVFAGLSFLSYQPGRLFFLLPLALLFIKQFKTHIVYYLIIACVIASPLLFYLAKNPDYRLQEVMVKRPYTVVENIQKTALSFVIRGDMNGRHNFPGKPALNPIAALLFLAGLVFAIRNSAVFSNQVMLGYFLLALVPAIFTEAADNPNMLRSFTALPAVSYFIAYPLAFAKKRVVYIVLLFLIVISSAYELRTYFLFQSRVFRNSFEVQCSIQELVKTHPEIFDTKLKLRVGSIPKECWTQKNEF